MSDFSNEKVVPTKIEYATGGMTKESSVQLESVPIDAIEELQQLVQGSKGKHFVFFFGSPAAGKTAVLGALIKSMEQSDVGRIDVLGAEGSYFSQGLALWKGIRDNFDSGIFPARTAGGKTIQLLAQFNPPGEADSFEIVFLEMAGEDLKEVQINNGKRAFPIHVDTFLKIKSLRLAFVIVVPWDRINKDQNLIEDFLSHLVEVAPHVKNSRVILLVTKWDSFGKAHQISAEDLIRQSSPKIYNKISNTNNVIMSFSVGSVVTMQNAEIIDDFDGSDGQRLFSVLYETFTGISSKKPKKSWWKRVLGN